MSMIILTFISLIDTCISGDWRIPLIAVIVLLSERIVSARAILQDLPAADCARVLIPLLHIYVKVMEGSRPLEAAEEQSVPPEEHRVEREFVLLVGMKQVNAEIVVLGFTVHCKIQTAGETVVHPDMCFGFETELGWGQ